MKTVMYEDKEILESLYNFMNAVKKKNPTFTFGVGKQMRHIMGKDPCFADLDVFTDEDTKPIGSIAIDRSDSYCVTSRLIQNDKYSEWSGWAFRTKRSQHINVAVKTAMKFLKPVGSDEIFHNQHDGFLRLLRSRKSKLTSGLESVLTGIGTTARLTEIKNMIEVGYTPRTPEFIRVVEYIKVNQAEMDAQASYNPTYAMVRIKNNGEVEYGYGTDLAQKQFTKVPSKDKLPQEILGKMFVLDIAEVGIFTEDVGVRTETNLYWVVL